MRTVHQVQVGRGCGRILMQSSPGTGREGVWGAKQSTTSTTIDQANTSGRVSE